MRTFETGASRDSDNQKLDYEGFLSPLVLQRFAEYMHRHRIQADGSLRSADNWQKLFGSDHFSVCMKSLSRHHMAVWLAHRHCPTEDTLEDSLCGIMFNTMAYLLGLLKKENDSSNLSTKKLQMAAGSGPDVETPDMGRLLQEKAKK